MMMIDGFLHMPSPPGSKILRTTVRLEDVTLSDAPSETIAQQEATVVQDSGVGKFHLEVDERRLISINRYILTASAEVDHPSASGRWRYGVTQAYPWPSEPPVRLQLRPLYLIGGVDEQR